MIGHEVIARIDAVKPVVKKAITDITGNAVYYAIHETGTIDAFGEAVRERFPRFVKVNPAEPTFKSKFLELLPNGTAIGLGPHGSHVEGLVIADGVNELVNMAEDAGYGELLPGFIIPVAASMKSGHQGPFLKGIYPHMEAYAADRRLKYMPTIREKDKEKYGMTPRLEDRKEFNDEMAKGLGVMALPEASVEAGRHPRWYFPFGSVNGMQEAKSDDLFNLYKNAKNNGRGEHPFFVLMAYSGAHHLYSPDSKWPTPEGLLGLWEGGTRFMGRFGYGRPVIEVNFVDVVSDYDLGIADLDLRHVKGQDKAKVVKHINTYLMRKIAMAVEERYRGFYGKVVKPGELVLAA